MRDNFRLPTFLELSKEQDRVLRNIQECDRSIVAGAPGTGKSVIVLLLSEQMKRRKKEYLCLVYNRVLKKMSSDLVSNLVVNTWHSWFTGFFRKHCQSFPPQIKPFQYDWKKILQIFDDKNLEKDSEAFIIIDEGQDMPPEFYDFMDDHFQNVFVAADENQQMYNTSSCLKEIKTNLDVSQRQCFELHGNYRNTRQIAKLARTFYCNTRVSPPELPERNGEIPILVDHPDKNALIQRIARRHRVNPDLLIAVLVPNNTSRDHYYQQLKQMGVEAVYTYSSKFSDQNRPIKFDSGGIVVLNAKSSKGLEFDEVFIAELDQFYFSSDLEAFKKEMYVLTSRAKEQLFILINTRNNPNKSRRILCQFPDDQEILRRWPTPPIGEPL